MVDFGLWTCLENQLSPNIILVGGSHEKELVELNNMGTNMVEGALIRVADCVNLGKSVFLRKKRLCVV
jgi:hypothetical protein